MRICEKYGTSKIDTLGNNALFVRNQWNPFLCNIQQMPICPIEKPVIIILHAAFHCLTFFINNMWTS